MYYYLIQIIMRIFMDSNINSMYEDGRTRGLLLGDTGYPCLPYLMTTIIARPATDNERHYNDESVSYNDPEHYREIV